MFLCSAFLLWRDNVGMRRWIFIAALSVALLAIPLWAQRGGAGGGHGGTGMGGGHGYAGASHSGPAGGGYHGGGSWGGGYHGGVWHGSYPGHYPHYPGHTPYYGWRYPWGYYGGWYGYPWVSFGYGGSGWYDGDYSYPAQGYVAQSYPAYVYVSPDNGDASTYDQQQEIDRLNNEVDHLRAEREAGTSGDYAPQPAKPEIHASTVLVFRDGHSEEIQNYAIAGKTLWVFTEQRARKIPITELNLPATTKANEARGVDFRLPSP